jgi:hypothetical protein
MVDDDVSIRRGPKDLGIYRKRTDTTRGKRQMVKEAMASQRTVGVLRLRADQHYSTDGVARVPMALGRCRRSRSSLRPP